MIFIEEVNDVFNYEGKAWLAHCISADFGMGKGIVVEFNKRYDLKNFMIKNHVRYNWCGRGYCIAVKDFKVFNLVTKNKVTDKPTYETLKQSLLHMKVVAHMFKVDTIAMPAIGCGLDKLDYETVKGIIKNIFRDTDMTIIVCKLGENN